MILPLKCTFIGIPQLAMFDDRRVTHAIVTAPSLATSAGYTRNLLKAHLKREIWAKRNAVATKCHHQRWILHGKHPEMALIQRS